ncbi:DNA-binding response OmpR family regulator [Kribbella voronezhensis]|uniref:DNA-binding response OmpR family regulator n=1 Tax=Kribbella voronezhensis TaxID=2512212 RepID=A0A4R7SVU6_9ACTN|nr:response regulator transcription factor [Kribbella voronezhensis]TDU83311.1 DNA-binding response OmpR family regulator [Kribbella voronezhensis]
MTKILVVDDEPDLVRFVRRALEADGYQVLTATEGAQGLLLALTEEPDMTVLDLRMPGVDGQAVLAGVLATRPGARVLVLSAAADIEARIDCLERGAVDFLAKPFAIRELLARVRSRLQNPGDSTGGFVLQVGRIALDIRARRLRVDGRETTLSEREFLLMQHFMRNPDAVCSRSELLSAVWGYDFDPATNVVDVYVGRLRAKLRRDVIQTVRNVGYQLQSA